MESHRFLKKESMAFIRGGKNDSPLFIFKLCFISDIFSGILSAISDRSLKISD